MIRSNNSLVSGTDLSGFIKEYVNVCGILSADHCSSVCDPFRAKASVFTWGSMGERV